MAIVIDILLILALTAPLEYLVYGHDYFFWVTKNIDLLNVYGVWDALLTHVLPLLLIVTFWRLKGATPGKRLMHCKVVDAETLGQLSWRQAVTRLLTYALSILPFYLGFFWIIWDKHRQGFHDKLAHTLVLYAPDDYAVQSLDELMEPSQ